MLGGVGHISLVIINRLSLSESAISISLVYSLFPRDLTVQNLICLLLLFFSFLIWCAGQDSKNDNIGSLSSTQPLQAQNILQRNIYFSCFSYLLFRIFEIKKKQT